MKKLLIIAGAIFFTGVGFAVAQSVATQIVVGTQSVVNGFPQWAPISLTNPLPVISQ